MARPNTYPKKTIFPAGAGFLGDSSAGVFFMESKPLKQNIIGGNVSLEFDPDKPDDEGGYAYYTGDNVTYDGDNYVFVLNHKSGAWNPSEVEQKPLSETINLQGVGQAVQEWLDEHPEATTTVEDGSITEQKLAESLKLKTIKEYVTPEMFGAVGDGVTDDSVAIQDAVNYLESRRGGIIFFDSKTYRVDNSININNDSDNKSIAFIGCGKQDVGSGVPVAGSYIASYCINTICIKSGTKNICFDGLNFAGMLPRSNSTKLFSVYGTSGYVARISFRNMSIRSFDYAFDLVGGQSDGYVDGSEFYNIRFNTVNKCIKAKHLEVCHIELCTAEPFLHYFVWAWQSNTLEIKNCIVRSLSNVSRDISITPVGVILDGVASYGKHICIHDCIFENSDVCVLSNNQKVKFYNIQYINDARPFDSTFIFGKWGGGSAEEIELENITTTYENGTDHYDVEVVKSGRTLHLFPYVENGVTYYELDFTLQALRCDGIRITGWNPTNNISGAVAGVERFFVVICKNFLQWINRNKIHFTEADENSPTDPQGNTWGYGDIICGLPKQAIDNWIGKIYTQRFGFVPFGQPIIAVTKTQATAYKSLTQGVSVYYKQDNIPLWSNGTEWVMHDGVPFTTPRRGASTERPTSGIYNGFMFFDTTLVKPIWYNSGNWVDATGTQV